MAYFDVLDAPFKKLVWFERSGHEPFVDEPATFNLVMTELVRPVVTTDLAAAGELHQRSMSRSADRPRS